jgi:hypothetical protein
MADRPKSKSKKNPHGPLVVALAAGLSITAAAERAGCDRKTVYTRMKDPEFMRLVTEARDQMISRAVGKIARTASQSVDTLRGLLKSKNETVRLGASRAILDVVFKMNEHKELSARLAEVESRIANRGTN